jgi:hypothetical protein
VQRVGWVILVLLLLAGGLGLFGGWGPLVPAVSGDQNGVVQVEYDRFVQYLAPLQFRIRVTPPADGGDTVRLWLDRAYLDQFTIQAIVPTPEGEEVGTDRVVYEFKLADAGQPFVVTFDVRHTHAGLVNGRAGLEDGPTITFWQLVFP